MPLEKILGLHKGRNKSFSSLHSYHPNTISGSSKNAVYTTLAFVIIGTLAFVASRSSPGVDIQKVACNPSDPAIVAAVNEYNSREGNIDHIIVEIPPEYQEELGEKNCELHTRTREYGSTKKLEPSFYSVFSRVDNNLQNFLSYELNTQ